MFRHIPPAGHPISPKCALAAIAGINGAADPLRGIFGKRPYYLSSGTAALTLSLMALKKNGRDKVIFPAYTCPSLLASVLKAGLRPVLCDIEPHRFRMAPEQLESKADSATLGIIAVHLFGIPERMDAVRGIASGKKIAVVEDATQAAGCRDSGKLLGTIGDLGVLSFRRGKPVSFLAGGALLVNNPEYEQPLKNIYDALPADSPGPSSIPYIFQLLLFSVLFHPRLYWLPQSLPWLRLGETIFTTDYSVSRLNARVLRVAPRVCADMGKARDTRSRLAAAYSEKLERYRDEFLFMPDANDCMQGLLRYPLVFKRKRARDRALAGLKRLGASGMYPAPVNEITGVPPEFRGGHFPNASLVSENILTLPLHVHVTESDISAIVAGIGKAIEGNAASTSSVSPIFAR